VTLAKAKTSTKKTSNTTSSAGAIHSNIISTLPGDPATQAEQLTETSAAAAAPTSNNSYLWWMAAALLALLAAASIVVAKRFGKNEWDIVEETAE
jgi:Na+-driven multidrug efflux pump